MTARPHCGQCRSTAVYQDRDPGTGAKSICCIMCGNRWPGGGPGFYMAEGNKMSIRATCVNCKRENMVIVREKMCFSCSAVSATHPAPGPARNKAMDDVAEKAKKLPGPHRNKSHGGVATAAAAAQRPPKIRRHGLVKKSAADIEREIDEIVENYTIDPEKQSDRRGRKSKQEAAPPPAIALPLPEADRIAEKPIILIRFIDADAQLFEKFLAVCRKERRQPADQVLFMIDEALHAAVQI